MADTTPTLTEMEQVLQAELERLGKTTTQAGEYSPPSGDVNIPFDLHAQVIDPDGEGGADPLGVHVTWTERLVGDYNMDGLVNASDLTPLGQNYNQTVDYRSPNTVGGVEYWPEGPPYNMLNPQATSQWRMARIDGNGDGLINMQDITAIGQHWQERITRYGFLITRPGESTVVVMDPANPTEPFYVEHGRTQLTEMLGADWPDIPVMYEIDLPIQVEAGDVLTVIPLSEEAEGVAYPGTCTREIPINHNAGPLYVTQRAFGDAYIVYAFLDDEPVGSLAYIEEYLCGDLDGNGISHGVETSLIYKYYGTSASDYPEPISSLVDRMDWNRDTICSVADITPVGQVIDQRLDGVAFTLDDGWPDYVPVMEELNPERRLIIPRALEESPNQDYVYRGWLPITSYETQIGICAVSSSSPEPEISEPWLCPVFLGQVSSGPTAGLPVVCVLALRGDELTGQASFSTAGELVEYAWYVDEDETADFFGATLSLSEIPVGSLQITLKVTDDQGNTAEVTRQLL